MSERHMTYRDLALNLVRARGIARARDLKAAGVPLVYLKRLTDAGDLVRLGRGLYQEPDRMGEDIAHDLAEAARRIPNGVVSLLSALRFHELTTQLPHAVWMTIPHRARSPSATGLRLEIVRATGEVLTAGIEHVDIEGVAVPIYGVAKTVADCFKHRRSVGEDVAIEALRDALHQRKTTSGELMKFAAIDRVSARMVPYIKAMQ
ncbi:type IV toxin-antitoxin system AbiEi family antitoxin domain-containing protein [Gluconacetobacter entanii]|uniref:type IV toxin-antitoxin system AbiEi family antitoxin domain-containing protein n=1 Tax=Gluconacetobacter entanii TaxID=108528 RepID=UPI001C935C35|nr:type IV toxin-antitoxin system AbiEi family antitoxin domain-containing protein [Gluconacetobacter entanii]MBY4640511.1 type IV toxin-antitoxin system AbiEi family antitoxin domain-containing protein [Gluconacetobacter entanii]MCW4579110.1 type IV toxin-antitoxin system AbiEi family antitoxin domain-containing protein [Gluconacetobacter entanii]MCW4582517.1 type IV toxin-antitoxin system AbiEi family antitoxin domain-containing protein [Gluconacetobacter entanii]MCW4585884.1 type IV toxin-an